MTYDLLFGIAFFLFVVHLACVFWIGKRSDDMHRILQEIRDRLKETDNGGN